MSEDELRVKLARAEDLWRTAIETIRRRDARIARLQSVIVGLRDKPRQLAADLAKWRELAEDRHGEALLEIHQQADERVARCQHREDWVRGQLAMRDRELDLARAKIERQRAVLRSNKVQMESQAARIADSDLRILTAERDLANERAVVAARRERMREEIAELRKTVEALSAERGRMEWNLHRAKERLNETEN